MAYWIAKRQALLSSEQGTIYKVDVDVTIALCYPHSYHIGMSNLGFQTAYHHFNQPENVKAERAFYEHGAVPHTLETGRPLTAFHYVGFSIDFELNYDHFLAMLAHAKIPLMRDERTDRHPLIFVGGFVTFFNIRPLMPFIDFACIGECEELFPRMIDIMIHHSRARASKANLLKELAAVDGIYVPTLPKKVKPQIVSNLDRFETISRIITPHTEFKNTFLIEIARGCFHHCKFCVSGHVYEQARVRSARSIIQSIQRSMQLTKRIGLIASAPSDYPQLDELCRFVGTHKLQVSFSSLYASSITEDVLAVLVASGQRTLTLAPETGSEKLRMWLGKNISNDCFYEVVHRAKKHGIKRIRLYMMIGLPQETERDVRSTIDFIRAVAHNLPTRVSITPFIPKPCTPFEPYNIEDKKTLKYKLQRIQHALCTNSKVTLVFDSARSAQHQAMLAKGNEQALLKQVEKLATHPS